MERHTAEVVELHMGPEVDHRTVVEGGRTAAEDIGLVEERNTVVAEVVDTLVAEGTGWTMGPHTAVVGVDILGCVGLAVDPAAADILLADRNLEAEPESRHNLVEADILEEEEAVGILLELRQYVVKRLEWGHLR